MTPNPVRLRIFISSPGDVEDERKKAAQVIAGLQHYYAEAVILEPVLWEDLPLRVDCSFQEGIDVILRQEPIDIAVFILWNRLGSPLGKSILTPEGEPYRSGTEREFDLMLAAREASGGARPEILFYRRSDDAGFNERLDARNRRDEELEQLLEQRKLARAFVEERFRDEEGHNTRAYHSFDRPVDFAQRLRVHLRGLIDRRIEGASAPGGVRWTEAPYRGLETFQLEHADIFFGRDEAIYRLESLLRRREREESDPCAFAAVIGASGSGKSSLVRAGLRASLLRHNLDESIAQWRSAVLVPGQTEGRPLEALLALLAEDGAVPELAAAGIAAAELVAEFAGNPRSATRLCLAPALTRAGATAGGAVKLLVVVDQFEELFTDPRIGEDQRETFLRALREIARSGRCWVVATLRSDFYPVVQRSAAFLELKGGSGQFDLLPPGPESLRSIVAEPARLAGIRFERREPDGLSLASRILEDAQNQPDLLPLLSDLLLDLYLKRRVSDDTITFETYDAMGGLEGALSQRAEALFSGLSPAQQALLPEVLHALITVEAGSEAFAVRRRAALQALRDTPEKAGLVDALIAGRLLTAEGGPRSAVATVSMAHEALIRGWARVADWVRENRDFLHIRSRVEQAQRRWEESGRDESLLLPAGLALEEGISLIGAEGLHLLRGSEYDLTRLYITSSREREEERQRREREHTRNLIEEARSNEGQGWLLRAQVAEERGHRYPGTLLYAARAIGFDGVGRPEEEDLPDLPRPILIGRDPELYHRARRWIAERPAYLPVWCAPAVESPALCLATSPDGRRLAAGFGDGSVRLWDFAAENELILPATGGGPAHAVAFDPGGGRLAVAQGGAVRCWRIGAEAFETVPRPGAVRALAWSPDGAVLAGAAEDGALLLWREGATDPERLATGESAPAARLRFSPDQSAVAAAFPGAGLRLYFPEAGQPHSAWAEHRGDFAALAFSPDGARLAAGSGEGTVSLWDVAGARLLGEAVPQQRHSGAVRDLSFHPDGGQVASASADGTLKLWDAKGAVPGIVATFTGHEGAVEAAVFLPGGGLLASAGADGGSRLWDVSGRVGSAPDLYAYVGRGWYGFDPETQEARWQERSASGWLNLPPRSLPAILRSGSGGGFDLLLASGDWPGAAIAAASLAERERLGALLLADAEAAAKEGRWHRVRLRLSQREALGGGTDGETPPARPAGLRAWLPGAKKAAASPTDPITAALRERIAGLAAEGAPFTNGDGLGLLWCPAGEFMMGEADQPGPFLRHRVLLTRGFWLSTYQVTQAQYEAVMGHNPSTNLSSGPQAPAENFSWHEALEFCRRLTDRERARGSIPRGWEYTLPTEAQWEYACRAGTTTRWSFGDNEREFYRHGNFNDKRGNFGTDSDPSQDDGHKYTAPVGSYLPNPWGFYDMHGNVNEWCRDAIDPENCNYPAGPVTDPLVTRGPFRVDRGGSFDYAAALCRSADRDAFQPTGRDYDLGLRPALVPAGPPVQYSE